MFKKLAFVSLSLVLFTAGTAIAAEKKAEKNKEQRSESSRTAEFADEYRARRRQEGPQARDKDCSCRGSAGCSCAPSHGYGYGYYGYGYWGGYGGPGTQGWSRSNWSGSDIGSAGYTPPARR